MTLEQNITITGMQDAQAANVQIIAALKPTGAVGKAVKFLTTDLHRYAVSKAHVDTGAMRASIRMNVQLGGEARGLVFVDGSGRNPKSGQPVSAYAKVEELRGGSHAYMGRTVRERATAASVQAGKIILAGMPRGN